MNIKPPSIAAATCAILSLATTGAFGWGAGRSFHASGYRGSISHTSGTSGGYGRFSHYGTTTATGRYGNSVTTSHSGSGAYGYGGATYHGSTYRGGTYGGAVYHTGGYGVYRYGGCYHPGVGYGAAVVAGAAIGAAAATAATAPPPPYPYPPGAYYHPPVY